MADKPSSQKTADALFLLDALQHVTSTVMVSLLNPIYLHGLLLIHPNIRSMLARSQPRKMRRSTLFRNASLLSSSDTISTFKQQQLAVHLPHRPRPNLPESPKPPFQPRLVASRSTLPKLVRLSSNLRRNRKKGVLRLLLRGATVMTKKCGRSVGSAPSYNSTYLLTPDISGKGRQNGWQRYRGG